MRSPSWGRGSPLGTSRALPTLDLERAADIADALRAASILAPSLELDFAHPILRVAADETMGPDERALAHARAAKLLADDGAPPDRLALHLLHAHPRGDVGVVAVLRAAAAVASGRGAPETAATCLRRALEEPPPRRYAGRCCSSSAWRRWRPDATRSRSPSFARRSR